MIKLEKARLKGNVFVEWNGEAFVLTLENTSGFFQRIDFIPAIYNNAVFYKQQNNTEDQPAPKYAIGNSICIEWDGKAYILTLDSPIDQRIDIMPETFQAWIDYMQQVARKESLK